LRDSAVKDANRKGTQRGSAKERKNKLCATLRETLRDSAVKDANRKGTQREPQKKNSAKLCGKRC